jgi:hypothetical protein
MIASPEPLTFDVFEHDADHAYAVFQSVAIHMWRGAMREHHPAQARDRWAQLRQSAGTFGVLVVILPSAPPPPTHLRNAVMQAYHAFAGSIGGVGTVLEDQGVRGAAAAMAMTAIMLMSKPPYAYRNDTSIDATAAWLARMLPKGPDGPSLSRAVQQLRARYAVVCESAYREPLIRSHAPPRSLRPR